MWDSTRLVGTSGRICLLSAPMIIILPQNPPVTEPFNVSTNSIHGEVCGSVSSQEYRPQGGATPSTKVDIKTGDRGFNFGGLRRLNYQNCQIFAHSSIGILFVTKFSHFSQMVPFFLFSPHFAQLGSTVF